jgi:hypothetical protein
MLVILLVILIEIDLKRRLLNIKKDEAYNNEKQARLCEKRLGL